MIKKLKFISSDPHASQQTVVKTGTSVSICCHLISAVRMPNSGKVVSFDFSLSSYQTKIKIETTSATHTLTHMILKRLHLIQRGKNNFFGS